MKKKDIREISTEEIQVFANENHLPKYRSEQLNKWIWSKGASDFEEMTSLSKKIRILLKENFILKSAKIHQQFESEDGTLKYSFILHDKYLIEAVLIPSNNRITACISSQIGCSLSCAFCATGKMKIIRNLTHGEMYDQAFKLNLESEKKFGKKITNIVFMGMGEPLINYSNVIKSIELITSNQGMSMSPKRITVSTVGLSKMIMKLADDNKKFNLAISLHSTNNNTRSKLMPINDKNKLSSLKESIRYYHAKTQKRITYEYILFKDINDNIKDAEKLAKFCKTSPCKINIIEYNNVSGSNFKKSSNKKTMLFIRFLKEKNMIVTLRKSKGKDIDAACGQLINNLM